MKKTAQFKAFLKDLRTRIEEALIPAMTDDAERLAGVDCTVLSDSQLADEIARRKDIRGRWVSVYWSDFIPFAHGMRLFGQFYNDRVKPEDPYEFMDLLGRGALKSLERNQQLEEMAQMMRVDPSLPLSLREYKIAEDSDFRKKLDAFIRQFGDLSCSIGEQTQCLQGSEGIIRILLTMASRQPVNRKRVSHDLSMLTSGFLSRFEGKDKAFAAELLDLGPSDMFAFESGEVLVCDAIEPTMTFVVLLASGIIERRGGMLIHGAIIAREYGLPCVTGVPEATAQIHTGDKVTVDGYLGIVIIG